MVRDGSVIGGSTGVELFSKKNQSWMVVKAVKTDFIQDYCNRGKDTSVENWAQF